MNVASLIGSQYEQVTVNSLSYSPSLTLNLSLPTGATSDQQLGVLRSLAANQDTLLELSGCPFSLVSLLSSSSLFVSKTVRARDSQRERDEEALFYLGVGAAVALVLSVCLLLCVLHSIRHPLLHPKQSQSPPSPFSPFRYADPPTAIYTEQFASKDEEQQQQQQRHQRMRGGSNGNGTFTPLDDNLFPVETEVDFTPRYLLDQEPEDMATACYRADSPMPELTRLLQEDEEEADDDSSSTIGRRLPRDIPIGRTPTNRQSVTSSTLVPNGRPGLSGGRLQPDIVESTVSLPLLSPFYDPSLRSPSSLFRGGDGGPVSPAPSSTAWAPSLASTPEPPRPLVGSARRRGQGKPPPPPRTDSLSSRSTSRKRRPLSVPAPCHLSVRGNIKIIILF
jgi:hypothetical protein